MLITAHDHAWTACLLYAFGDQMVMPFRQHNAVDIRENGKASNALHVLLVIRFSYAAYSELNKSECHWMLSHVNERWRIHVVTFIAYYCTVTNSDIQWRLQGLETATSIQKMGDYTWPLLTGIPTFSLDVPPSNITPWLQILKCKNTCS